MRKMSLFRKRTKFDPEFDQIKKSLEQDFQSLLNRLKTIEERDALGQTHRLNPPQILESFTAPELSKTSFAIEGLQLALPDLSLPIILDGPAPAKGRTSIIKRILNNKA